MQVRCVRPFGNADVGDVADVPDGAEFDDFHWEAVESGPGQQPDAAPAPAPDPARDVPHLPPAPGARIHPHWPQAAAPKEM